MTDDRIDVELLRTRVEAYARRYAHLATVHQTLVERTRRVLELLDPQALLIRTLTPPPDTRLPHQEQLDRDQALLDGLDLLIERLEELADPSALLAIRPGSQVPPASPTPPSPPAEPQPESKPRSMQQALPRPEDLGEREQEFLKNVGSGTILLTNLTDRLRLPRARVHEVANRLAKMGIITLRDIDIPLGPAARRQGIPARNRVARLTEVGIALYRDLFGDEPMDTWANLVGRYKSIEAAFFVQGLANLLRSLNELEERIFDLTVLDPMTATDEELAGVPNARRQYVSADGQAHVEPDLLVWMEPRRGGTGLLIAVEAEFGHYPPDKLADKWTRALLCYPPIPLYVISPNTSVQNRLFREMEKVRRQMVDSHGFSHWVRYVFYTADEIARHGILSPSQIVRLEMARKRGEKPSVALPRYFFQKPTRREEEKR